MIVVEVGANVFEAFVDASQRFGPVAVRVVGRVTAGGFTVRVEDGSEIHFDISGPIARDEVF